MLKPRTALFLLAADPEQHGGGDTPPTPAAAIQAIEDKTLPMSQRLTVAMNALKGIPPAEQFAQVQADLANTQATLQARENDLAAAQARVTALETDLAAIEAEKAALAQENVTLKAQETDLTKRTEARVKEQMASLGFPAAALPNPDAAVNQENAADLWKQAEATADAKEKGRLAMRAIALNAMNN